MSTATSNSKARFDATLVAIPRLSHIGFWTDQRGINGERFLGSMKLATTLFDVGQGVIEYDPGELQIDLPNGTLSPYMARLCLDGGITYEQLIYAALHSDYPESIGSNEIIAVPRYAGRIWTVTISDYPFGPPTGVTITQFSQTRLDVAWVAPFDLGGRVIDGYKIENSADGITFVDLVADTGLTATGYQHTGVFVANTTYYYRVTALDGTVESPVSVVGVVTTGS